MIFIELDARWFENEFNDNQTKFEYPDEPYSQLVDHVFGMIPGENYDMDQKVVLIQYPDGSRQMVANEVTKYVDDNIVAYDFELNIWKHLYTIGIKHRNGDGLETLDKVLTYLQSHPSYKGTNPKLLLVGEKTDEPQCYTCGGWKQVE